MQLGDFGRFVRYSSLGRLESIFHSVNHAHPFPLLFAKRRHKVISTLCDLEDLLFPLISPHSLFPMLYFLSRIPTMTHVRLEVAYERAAGRDI